MTWSSFQHHKSGRLPVRHESVAFSLPLWHRRNKDCLVCVSPPRSLHHSLEAQAAVVRFKDNLNSLSFSHALIPLSFFFFFWFSLIFNHFLPLCSTPSLSPLSLSFSLLSKQCFLHMAQIMSGGAKREETRLTIRRGTLTEGFK